MILRKIILAIFYIAICIFPVQAIVSLNYTENYDTYQTTLDNDTYSLFTKNVFRGITLSPDYDMTLKSYYINSSFIIDAQYYNISNQYYIYKSNNLLKGIYSYDTQNSITLYIDDVESERFVTNHSNYKILTNPVIYLYIFDKEGFTVQYYVAEPIKTAEEIYTFKKIPQNRITTIRSIQLNKSDESNIYASFAYQKELLKTKRDVIQELNPILKLIYNPIGWLDNGNFILNIFTLMTYIINIMFFWIPVLVISFPAILIIIFIAVIPTITLFTTNSRWEFISKLYDNEAKFIEMVLNFFKEMIDLATKLIQSLPFF